MEDRFKFRFWDKEEKVMLDWDCICQTAFNCYIREEGNKMQRYGLMYWAFTTPSKFIPLQCTGLKDKNGKLIFEGDIVKHNNQYIGINPLIVKYCEDYCGLFLFEQNSKNKYAIYYESIEYEVIGNIYANPELLKEVEGE